MRPISCLAGLLATLAVPGVVVAQAAVVTDPTLTAATQAGFVSQAAKLAQQIEQMRQQVAKAEAQLDQAKAQYTALTGTRNLGEILNSPAFRDYLPAAWQGVYDGVRQGGYAGLTGAAQQIQKANQVFDTCAAAARDPDPARAQQALAACQGASALSAQHKSFAQDAFSKARDRLQQIEQLMGTINTTKDPKAIAELQARIAIEQAAIQNEQTKLQMFQLAAAAERELQQQRAKEVEARFWSSQKGLTPPPSSHY